MKSEQLHIQMFGEFHMKNDYHQFIPSSSKGTQVTTLIPLLIHDVNFVLVYALQPCMNCATERFLSA